MQILNRTPLTILRKSSSNGYLKDGVFIEETLERELPIRCSLQPYSDGKKMFKLPEGRRAEGAYLIYTKSRLQTADDILNRDADECIIDGLRHEIFQEHNWSRNGLLPDHYKYLVLRKDKT